MFDEAMRRLKTIPVRVTPAEYDRMKSMSLEHGSMSQLIRFSVLETNRRTRGLSIRDYRLLAQLNANLRAIARVVSRHGVDGIGMLIELCAIERTLKEKLL